MVLVMSAASVSRLGARLSKLSLINGAVFAASVEPCVSKVLEPTKCINGRSSIDMNITEGTRQTPLYLPGCTSRTPKVYTFPTPSQHLLRAPAPFIHELIEKFDPSINKNRIEEPSIGQEDKRIYAGPRMLTIRRKKMKKHKRRKRYDRDFFKYAKYHREKKLKAEKAFRARMNDLLEELNSFSAEGYVSDVIRRAKQEWTTKLTPSGRNLYPHWSTLMSLEELYGLDKSDYIDKNAGLASPEDVEKIEQLKIEYYRQFRNENIPSKKPSSKEDDTSNKNE